MDYYHYSGDPRTALLARSIERHPDYREQCPHRPDPRLEPLDDLHRETEPLRQLLLRQAFSTAGLAQIGDQKAIPKKLTSYP